MKYNIEKTVSSVSVGREKKINDFKAMKYREMEKMYLGI